MLSTCILLQQASRRKVCRRLGAQPHKVIIRTTACTGIPSVWVYCLLQDRMCRSVSYAMSRLCCRDKSAKAAAERLDSSWGGLTSVTCLPCHACVPPPLCENHCRLEMHLLALAAAASAAASCGAAWAAARSSAAATRAALNTICLHSLGGFPFRLAQRHTTDVYIPR